jgi:hypothetical protein
MTSDRSLFPDRYPDRILAPKATLRRVCCDAIIAPPHVSPRLWGFIHDMAHGRVPFSARALAELAEVSLFDARRAVAAAESAGWVYSIRSDPCFSGTQVIGKLRRKR